MLGKLIFHHWRFIMNRLTSYSLIATIAFIAGDLSASVVNKTHPKELINPLITFVEESSDQLDIDQSVKNKEHKTLNIVRKDIIRAEETLHSKLFKGNKDSSKLVFDSTTGQSN